MALAGRFVNGELAPGLGTAGWVGADAAPSWWTERAMTKRPRRKIEPTGEHASVRPPGGRRGWRSQAINGRRLQAWVEEAPAPTLAPDEAVVMDHLAAHKLAGIRAAIAATGAEFAYLPPDGPDLNPIEQVVAKLKALRRRALRRHRPLSRRLQPRRVCQLPRQRGRSSMSTADAQRPGRPIHTHPATAGQSSWRGARIPRGAPQRGG